MKQIKLLLCLFTLIFAFTSFAQAQEAVELEKTVVTATRTETPIENLPVSVTVITKDDIEKMHAKTVDDVLNKAAGVRVKRAKGLLTTASHTSVCMRGTEHASRTLILKDGIPLNTVYIGSVDLWGTMSADNIEKIEIVRGASSALYGSSAMGGVVNIITRPAKKKREGSVSLEGGTFDTYIGNARFSGATEKYGLRVAAGHKRTKGYEYYEGDKWKDYYHTPENEITNASIGADIFLGESLLKFDYEYFLEDYLTRTSYKGDGEVENNHYMLSYSMPIGKIDFSLKSWYFDYSSIYEKHNYNKTTGAYDKFSYAYDVPKDDVGLMLQASSELGSHHLTVGSDLKWGECDSNYSYKTGQRKFSGKQDLYSVFVNDEILIGDKLILSAGVRYDSWKNHSGDYYDDTKAPTKEGQYPEKTDEALSPRAGIVYKLTEATKLRASFGTGFKVPSLYYLYKSGYHGKRFDLANPDLEAEKMPWSYDVGFDMKPNKNLNLTFTFYQSRFEDFLTDKTLDPSEVPPWFTPEPGQDVKQKINVGKVDIHGAEAGMEVAFNRKWSAFVNYTYNVSKVKEHKEKPEVEKNYLPYTPRHMTKLGFTYNNPNLFTLSVYLRNVGPMFGDLENTDKKKTEGFSVWDVKVSREIFKNMDLFLSIDNLTDEKYKEYYGYYNPPFTAMLGAKYTF
ncbi:MAG: TonB-dependent receptor [Deltaproteobacteria bacterium]|nr:TonB-dependent receptor [Deltaproteobacteria bacterium]